MLSMMTWIRIDIIIFYADKGGRLFKEDIAGINIFWRLCSVDTVGAIMRDTTEVVYMYKNCVLVVLQGFF